MRDIVIIGCGGFGREVHDIIDTLNAQAPRYNLLGYADDAASEQNTALVERRGSRVLGSLDAVLAQYDAAEFAIGIGSPQVRKKLDTKLVEAGWRAATLVHPSATFGGDVRLGEGSIVCAGVRVTTNVTLGRSVHLNLNATVGHDVTLHDYVSVNPLVAISGWVEAHEGVMFGTHSAILQNLSVGAGSVVGAGSCVVKNVPEGVVVKGVPAK